MSREAIYFEALELILQLSTFEDTGHAGTVVRRALLSNDHDQDDIKELIAKERPDLPRVMRRRG